MKLLIETGENIKSINWTINWSLKLFIQKIFGLTWIYLKIKQSVFLGSLNKHVRWSWIVRIIFHNLKHFEKCLVSTVSFQSRSHFNVESVSLTKYQVGQLYPLRKKYLFSLVINQNQGSQIVWNLMIFLFLMMVSFVKI